MGSGTRLGAVLGAALAVAPALAGAACPAGEDMARGVRITFADGITEDSVLRPGGVLQVARSFRRGGRDSDMVLGQGLYLLSLDTYAEDGWSRDVSWDFDFGLAPEAMPRPEPGKALLFRVDVSGPENAREEQTFRFGSAVPVRIGDCAYEALPVELSYPDGYVQEIRWLPELNLSFIVAITDRGARDVWPEPVSVVALRPGAG